MSGCPDKSILLQAYFDGELDAANSASLETHLASCAACTTALEQLHSLRRRLRAPDARYATPSGWRERVVARLPGTSRADRASATPAQAPLRPHGRSVPFLAGGGIGLAAGLAFAMLLPRALPTGTSPSAQEQVVASHVRSLLAQHLTDVTSSDRHQVKPWFNGRLDFAPPTPDLAPQGFPLAGGRLDYVDGRVVAAVVYRRRLHPINLFIRPVAPDTPAGPTSSKAEGYNLLRWRQGDLDYWVVSDLNARELRLFQHDFVTAAGR